MAIAYDPIFLVEIDAKQLHDFVLRHGPGEQEMRMRKALNECADYAMKALRSSGMPKFTGDLMSKVKKEAIEGKRLDLSIEVNSGGVPYAAAIEFGRRPGMAAPPSGPGSPLRDWVIRKGISEHRAFAIARAIGRRGFRDHRYPDGWGNWREVSASIYPKVEYIFWKNLNIQ